MDNSNMKQITKLLTLSATLLLASCSSASLIDVTSTPTPSSQEISTSAATSAEQHVDYSTLKKTFGAFSITKEDANADYTYDEETHTYILKVTSAAKAEFTLRGYFDGKLSIENPNGIEEGQYKGVALNLDNACLVNHDYNVAGSIIDYTLTSKNVQIKSKKGTNNKIIGNATVAPIYSNNNIEFSGSGYLDIHSYGKDAHAVKCDGDISIYGSHTLNVTYADHDAFHGKHLYFSNEGVSPYTGTVDVKQAVSQAFDFETNKGKGSIDVEGGNIIVNNCESVFKTDATLKIFGGATVTATGLSKEAVVKGDNSSGITYTCEGSFTVDGAPYTYAE